MTGGEGGGKRLSDGKVQLFKMRQPWESMNDQLNFLSFFNHSKHALPLEVLVKIPYDVET
jgi:hypothetical protein